MVQDHNKQPRLKPLLDAVPPGFLVDAAWLVARDIDRKSIHDYVRRGWLERVARGLYRRPLPGGVEPSTGTAWKLAVLSMQQLMGYDVHVGGRTALAEYGYVHYLKLGGQEAIYLYGKDIPPWLKRLPREPEFEVRTRRLFGQDLAGVDHGGDSSDANANINSPVLNPMGWELLVSSPERAILELIDELPNKESFQLVDKIFEGLSSLRPVGLGELLGSCRSVKVKRLFFVFADRHRHAWRKYVDPDKFDLGSGPRALVKGGRVHPTYRIYVPEEFAWETDRRVGYGQ